MWIGSRIFIHKICCIILSYSYRKISLRRSERAISERVVQTHIPIYCNDDKPESVALCWKIWKMHYKRYMYTNSFDNARVRHLNDKKETLTRVGILEIRKTNYKVFDYVRYRNRLISSQFLRKTTADPGWDVDQICHSHWLHRIN